MKEQYLKEFNKEVRYYIRAIAKDLISKADKFDVSEYTEIENFENSDMEELIIYLCYQITLNNEYTNNSIRELIKKLRIKNNWTHLFYSVMRETALRFILKFARLRRAKIKKDIKGKSIGNINLNNKGEYISTGL